MNQRDNSITKRQELHHAIEGALRDLKEMAGRDGYRQLYDQALHIIVAINEAGFTVVRKRDKAKAPEMRN